MGAYQQSLALQSVFQITAVAAPGHTPRELQKEIDAVLEDIRQNGVTKEEVMRARNRIETGFVAGLQSVSEVADLLQSYNQFLGQPDSFGRDLSRYEAVTPQTVQAVVNKYLKPDARVITYAIPTKQAAEKGTQPEAAPAGTEVQ